MMHSGDNPGSISERDLRVTASQLRHDANDEREERFGVMAFDDDSRRYHDAMSREEIDALWPYLCAFREGRPVWSYERKTRHDKPLHVWTRSHEFDLHTPAHCLSLEYRDDDPFLRNADAVEALRRGRSTVSDTTNEQPWCVGCGANKDAEDLCEYPDGARCYDCLGRREREAADAFQQMSLADRIAFGAAHGSALAQSWADAHDYLQSLCRKAGCSEFDVDGDSYGVPGIEQLADSLAERYEKKLRMLTDFINREMQMTASDPRVVVLARALEMPNVCVSDGPADAPELTRSAKGPFAARND